MKHTKTLQELTIKDNFMFGAVMCNEQNCKKFLEMALGFQIEKVEVSKEKSIIYHPQYKGVRLDIYAKDEYRTHYNVEMQAIKQPSLPRRGRYYHSQIDMELLTSGKRYEELPNSYVIFICDFDPFGEGKYCYTIQNRCEEMDNRVVDDGNVTIFLSTKGRNKENVSEDLIKFLNYVSADLEQSNNDFESELVASLQETVFHIKSNREMESRYMIFEEMLREERIEGKAEGKAEAIIMFLNEIGKVTSELQDEIMLQNDLFVLNKWVKLAAKSETVEKFVEQMYT